MLEVLAMTGYEKLLMIIRKQGERAQVNAPELAEMLSDCSLKIRELVLEKEDLLCADHLEGKLRKGDIVLIQRISEEKYVIIERVICFA